MGTKVNSNYEDLLTFTRASKGHALRPVSYGDELVENGDFSSTDLSDWTASTSSLSIDSGALKITSDGVAGNKSAYQVISGLSVGNVYEISVDVIAETGTSVTQEVRVGTNINGVTQLYEYIYQTDSTNIFRFVAGATSQYISILFYDNTGDATKSSTFDNISVKEVLFDQPDGTLTLFEHPDDVPRVEYDADGNRLGLLVEEQRVNQVTQSEDFGAGVWNSAAAGITVVRNDIAAPDGTMTADKLQEKATTDTHRRGFAISGANDKIFSFFAKAGERTKVRTWSFAGGNTQAATFDLSEGTVVTGSSGAKEGKIEYYGNGWYRCSSKIDGGQTTVVVGPMIDGVTGNNTGSYTGDGSSGVYVWGAQIEDNVSFPTSYIKSNSGSTTTRSADVASIPVSDFGWNNGAGTVVAEVDTADASNFGILWSANADSFQNRTLAYINNDLIYMYNRKNNGTEVNDPYANAPLDNTPLKHGYAFTDGDFNHTLNGGAVETVASNEMPVGINSFDIGNRLYTSGGHINGHIKSIKYYPRRLTNAQLVDLTS